MVGRVGRAVDALLAALRGPLGVALVADQRGRDADRERRRDEHEVENRPDVDPLLDQELHADDPEDDGDRLVEVAEAADQPLDEDEQGAQPEQREDVAGPDDQRLAGDRERRRDRVDREGDVRGDDRREAQEGRGREAAALLAHEPVPLAEAVGDREDLAHAAHDEVAVGVDVLPHALVDPVGEHEQQHAEHVEHEVELLDQRSAAEDRQAAQHERGDDPPEDQARPVLMRDAEVCEQQDEDEEVVERQRALDEVDGDVVDRVLAAVEHQHDSGHAEPEQQPADRPRHALAERRLAAAREEAQVDEQQHDQHEDETAEFD